MLRRFLAALALVLAFTATQASAQSLTTYTFATLPGSPTAGQLAWITDNSGTPTVGSPAAGGAAAGNRDLVAWDATQTRWEFVSRQPTAGSGAPLQSYMDAARVAVTNVLLGELVPNLQTALDMLFSYVRNGISYVTATDADGDGKYEWAMLRDFDGDGSFVVTCTGDGVAGAITEPLCKVAGERVNRDFVDDANCAMHGGCASGWQMELTGTLELEEGVIQVNFPCWEPTNTRNPSTASSDAAHATTAVSAWNDCPPSPDPVTTRRLGTFATLGWQGTIQGGGVDTRDSERTVGYKRDRGSYIVDDRGPTWSDTVDVRVNRWWGQNGFVRGLSFGFDGTWDSGTSGFINSGENLGDGDSKARGTVSGTQLITAMDSTLCAANVSGLTSLVAGDTIVIGAATDATSNTPVIVASMRVRATPTVTNCNGAGTIGIPLGGRLSYFSNLDTSTLGFNGYFGTDIPYATQVTTGAIIVSPRSDGLMAGATIRNVTIEPDDWWGEPGGDCSASRASASAPWTFARDEAQTDYDCDTMPLIGLFGGGNPRVEDVVLKHWHAYAIDGNSNIGNPVIERVRFMYGLGGPIVDYGTGWNLRDIEVRESEFDSGVFSTFGPGVRTDGVKVYGSQAYYLAKFSEIAVGHTMQNVAIEGSAIHHLFVYTCGARQNLVENLIYTNELGVGTTSFENGSIAFMDCSNTAKPIEENIINGWRLTGSGLANNLPGNGLVAISLNTHPTRTTPNTNAIVRNVFSNGMMRMDEPSASYEACLFGAMDDEVTTTRATGPNYNHEDVFSVNTFVGNSVVNTGSGADWVYCGCDVYTGSSPGEGTCVQNVGTGGGATAAARGCMNIDKTAKPSNETCS